MFELPPLKYAFNALDPVIDAMTMEIHHDKHHGAYVANLNKALESAPDLQGKPIEWLIQNLQQTPEGIRTAVRNNGGGHFNHTFFWDWIAPGGSKSPSGLLSAEINKTFGSFDAFVEKFSNAALTRFGSGWAWLVVDDAKKLQVLSTANQDNPLMDIAEVKRIYGDRLILMGNVRTSLLQDVEEEGIRESVRYCMVHGKPDGGFVFSTSNCLFQGMPIESYHIMLDEYEKWAYY